MPLTPVSWKSRIHASRMLMAKMMGGMQTMAPGTGGSTRSASLRLFGQARAGSPLNQVPGTCALDRSVGPNEMVKTSGQGNEDDRANPLVQARQLVHTDQEHQIKAERSQSPSQKAARRRTWHFLSPVHQQNRSEGVLTCPRRSFTWAVCPFSVKCSKGVFSLV